MAPSLEQGQSAQLERWNAWIACPRPRSVRLKQDYRFWCIFLIGTMLVVPSLVLWFMASEWRSGPPREVMNSDFWHAMEFVALPLVLLLLVLWIGARDRRLMTNGEISIGKITDVRFQRRPGPIVTYEFLDRFGRLITASSFDLTRSVTPGMAIPIFYNPENPRRSRLHFG